MNEEEFGREVKFEKTEGSLWIVVVSDCLVGLCVCVVGLLLYSEGADWDSKQRQHNCQEI